MENAQVGGVLEKRVFVSKKSKSRDDRGINVYVQVLMNQVASTLVELEVEILDC